MGTVELVSAEIEREIARPGVLLVHWWSSDEPAADLFSALFEDAALRNPGARFATVDAARERRLAREYDVTESPTLMVFRDGILIVTAAGQVIGGEIDRILVAVEALDMEEVRRSRNGRGRGVAALPAAWAEQVVQAAEILGGGAVK